MNKTLKLLALLVFAGAALQACDGCVEEPKGAEEAEEIAKVVDTEVEEVAEAE